MNDALPQSKSINHISKATGQSDDRNLPVGEEKNNTFGEQERSENSNDKQERSENSDELDEIELAGIQEEESFGVDEADEFDEADET